jgi:hypothetical protein
MYYMCYFVLLNICVFCFYVLFAFFDYKHICTAFIHTYCMTFSSSFELYSVWIYGSKIDSDSMNACMYLLAFSIPYNLA